MTPKLLPPWLSCVQSWIALFRAVAEMARTNAASLALADSEPSNTVIA